MADKKREAIPLLEQDTSGRNNDDLDQSQDTDTTDDEYQKEIESSVNLLKQAGPSSNQYIAHFEQAGPSSRQSIAHIEQAGRSSNSPTSDQTKCSNRPGKAASYFAGETLTSSSGSNKVSSAASSVDGYKVEYTRDEEGNVDYVDIDFDETISQKHVAQLMNKLRLNHYTSVSCEGDFMLSKCKGLYERDYYCEVIGNFGGSLTINYPVRVIIPVARKSKTSSTERLDAPDFNLQWYHRKVKQSVYSRLLTRFVVPVILFDKKFICRSGSLTVRKTAAFESARHKEVPRDHDISPSRLHQIARRLADSLADIKNRTRMVASQLFFPNSMAKLRDVDAEIMRDLNIEHVCDLMVEDRKKFKQTIRISSSEKINKDIFKDSAIEQMPYPGCSFFKEYHDANYLCHELVFDWKSPDVDVVMKFSIDPYEAFPDVNWENYKEWDIVHLTRNYLKMLLLFLVKDAGGMLVHCISGWDRTPLFISILRVSLWADGLIHESLDYRDMAYLTLAYDWYLFGHNLPRRLNEKQEIMHFCFNFLRYIANDEFSAVRMFHELPDDEKRGRAFPEYVPERRQVLKMVSLYVLDEYAEHITKNMN